MSLVKGRPGDLFTSFTELGHFVSVYFVSSESMITKFFESFDNLMILKQFMRQIICQYWLISQYWQIIYIQ